MKTITLIILLAISTPVGAEDFNWFRTVANTVIVLDWMQTRSGLNSGKYYETNSFLGTEPSQSEINRYFITSIVAYNILGELLPEPYGNMVYLTVGVVGASSVVGNYNVGVRIEF